VLPEPQVVTRDVTIPDPAGADITEQRVTCPEGTVAIGGGYRNLGPQSMEFPRDGFYPDGRDWVIDMGAVGLSTQATVRLSAVCLEQ
jgi:hypothetical protein